MNENERDDILVMAIFVVTRDDVISAAAEMGLPPERITADFFERVTSRVSRGLGNWRESIEGMVKEAIGCPLGQVCAPGCVFRDAGECLPLEEVN